MVGVALDFFADVMGTTLSAVSSPEKAQDQHPREDLLRPLIPINLRKTIMMGNNLLRDDALELLEKRVLEV